MLKKHKTHLIVGILPLNQQKLKINRARILTKFIAFVISEELSALAVYWGSGKVVHSKENLIERSVNINSDDIPWELWIDFRIEVSGDKKCSIITTRMNAFRQ